MSKIDFRFVSRAQRYPGAVRFVVFGQIWIRNGIFFWTFQKLLRKKFRMSAFIITWWLGVISRTDEGRLCRILPTLWVAFIRDY